MSNCRHGVNSKYCKVCANYADGLTKEQITNLRKTMSIKVGLIAFTLPVSAIVEFRNKIQAEIDKLIEEVTNAG